MKTEGLAQSIRRVLGALLFCCVLLCGAALAEAYPQSGHPDNENMDQSTKLSDFRTARSADSDFVIENGVLTQYSGSGGVVTVPDGVTTIGDSAFRQCFNVTKVILPDTVTSIEDEAFYDCSGMTSIEWSNQLRTIGVDAFRGCALKSIILPDSVTTIGSEAFSYCRQATELKLPAGLTTIKSYAFHYCSSLTEVVLPDTVTSIGVYAFGQCSALTSITMPDALTSIGINAFYQCTSLKECFLPDKITTIGKGAFDAATTLYCNPGTTTETTLKNAGIAYAVYPFTYTDNGDGTATITGYTGVETELEVPAEINGLTVRAIGDSAFKGRDSLTKVILPDSVTSIGFAAFASCSDLTEVEWPDNLETIGDWAFNCCDSLTNTTLPDSVTSIGDSVFPYCESMRLLQLPDNIEFVGTSTFWYTNVLWCQPNTLTAQTLDAAGYRHGVLSSSVPYVYSDHGDGTATLLGYFGNDTVLEVPAEIDGLAVTAIGPYAFYYRSALTKVVLPDTVISIDESAFESCYNLQEIKLSENLETIGNGAFAYCSNLQNITLPDSLTSIGSCAFCFCSNLQNITLPDSLTSIGDSAFFNCYKLTSITLPDGVTSIGGIVFAKATTIYCTPSTATAQTLTAAGYNYVALLPPSPFTYADNGDGTCTITGYTGTSANVTIPSEIEGLTVTAIGDSAFTNNKAITSVVIPEGVTTIDNSAFYHCEELTSVSLPSTLTTIAEGAFFYCPKLTTVFLPDNISSVDVNSFGYNNMKPYDYTLYCNPGTTTETTLKNAGIAYELNIAMSPMPASRISDQGIPYGLEVDVEITNGSIHAVFDDDNTNWNDVFTFLEPREWHDSITGESGVDYEPRFGAYFYVPEGAAYAKVAVGEIWESDEEILAYLRDTAQTETLMQGMRFGYWYRPATLDNGTVTLHEVGVEHPFVHVIQWLDEEQNVIATEKATIRFEHTNPNKTYTSTRTLIPAENIIANAENASGVTVEVADGSVSYTQNAENTVIVTEIIAPEGAVAYSMPGEFFDPDAERWPVDNGKIGYVREGALNDPVTACDFICWYDADGQLLGGGWIDFRYERAETLTIQPIPASRLSFGSFPFGMVAENKTTDGQAWVVINDEATDWNKVLTFNEAQPWYNPDTGESGYWEPTDVKFYLYISKPEGAAYTGYSPCGGISDEEIIRILTQPDMMEDTSYSMPSWGLDIASYDPETGVFLPIDVGAEDYEGPTTYAVAWADENKNVFLVEKVEVRYEHTSPEGSFPAEYMKLAAEDILPNADQAEGVKSSVADGDVLYTVKQDEKPESIVTRFTAPENAAYYTLTKDFRYAYWNNRQPVWNGQAAHTLTLDEPESTTYVLVWLDEDGNVLGGGRVSISWEEEAVPAVTLMPAANIRPDGLPFGMAADVTVEDGLFKVVIDDEATDWNDVFTFLDPDEWYNPDTGESGTYAGRVMVGAQMTDHEGAVYSKSIVGNVWETDEELLAYMDEVDEIEDLTSYGHGWWHNIAELDRESSTVTLQEIINTPSWTYAVQWLDADRNVLCTEKVVFEITHTNPGNTYPSTRTLIPAESIVGNAENMDGVTCEISDGLIVTTVENKQITTTTEIIAPVSAVTYSMPELDTSGERWELYNGRVGFQRMGWASAENETSKAYLLCWYDAEGQLIGGGWITMTDVCPIPEMILPAFVKEIQKEAFADSNVQRVIIPDGCTAIGERAFADCANLSEVHIPDSVTSIADNAFAGSPDVTIYAPAGSEGMRFAGDHDLKWANVSSFP